MKPKILIARAIFAETVDKLYRKRIPLGRIGETDDVVGAVVFLASQAASLITGANLLVDGGWSVA